MTKKHTPKRDPDSDGRDWLYRGAKMRDQSGSGASPAYRWEVDIPHTLSTSYFRTKAMATAFIDSVISKATGEPVEP